MHLFFSEIVKLGSMRSARWCGSLAALVAVGHSALWADRYRPVSGAASPLAESGLPPSVIATQVGCMPGVVLVMVMAALAATTEYRTGTITLTMLAEPNRAKVVVAKTAAVCVLAALIGECAAWLSYGAARLINPGDVGRLDSGAQVRLVAGAGLIYLVAAAAGVAIGMIVRSGVGAIAGILLYTLVIESLVSAVPSIGSVIEPWMPFTMATQFLLEGSSETFDGLPWLDTAAALPTWWALAYITTIAATLTACAAIVTTKRGT